MPPEKPEQIDHTGTKRPVCPSCGYEHPDLSDFPHDGDYNCHSCDKEFYLTEYVRVTFTTKPSV